MNGKKKGNKGDRKAQEGERRGKGHEMRERRKQQERRTCMLFTVAPPTDQLLTRGQNMLLPALSLSPNHFIFVCLHVNLFLGPSAHSLHPLHPPSPPPPSFHVTRTLHVCHSFCPPHFKPLRCTSVRRNSADCLYMDFGSPVLSPIPVLILDYIWGAVVGYSHDKSYHKNKQF